MTTSKSTSSTLGSEPEYRGVDRWRFLRRLAVGILLLILLAAASKTAYLIFQNARQRTHSLDFSIYYACALMTRDKLDPYTTDLRTVGDPLGLETGAIQRTDYTPTFLLFIEPLTLVSVTTAYWIWFVISVAATVIAFWFLIGPASGLSPVAAFALAALAIRYPPLETHFIFAQSQLLVLLMLVLVMRWLKAGKDAEAGLALSLAVLLRAYPIVLAGYLVATEKWRALAYMTYGLVIGSTLTLILIGMTRCVHFVQVISGVGSSHPLNLPRSMLIAPWNVSVMSAINRLFSAILGDTPSFPVRVLQSVTVFACVVILITLAITATRKLRDGDLDSRAFSFWVTTMILLVPTAWTHYMVLLFLPFSQLAVAAYHGRASKRAVWLGLSSYLLITVVPLIARYFEFAVSRLAMRPTSFALTRFAIERDNLILPSMMLAFLGFYAFAFDGDFHTRSLR